MASSNLAGFAAVTFSLFFALFQSFTAEVDSSNVAALVSIVIMPGNGNPILPLVAR